ncbi:hypothetical protein GGX14DRAFT_365184, partial [Mycena pura]
MIRAVLTRWNTVFDVIVRGLELQIALDRLCTTSTGRVSIKKLLLSNEEWQIMYQLQAVLKVMRRFVSRQTSSPASSNPFFVHPKAPKPTRAHPKQRATFNIVRMAAVAGLGILDKYYTKTDDSVMYRLAM